MNFVGKTADDYWNSSSNKNTLFLDDEEEVCNLFECLDSDTDLIGTSTGTSHLPLSTLISPQSLQLVLNEAKLSDGDNVPSVDDAIMRLFLGNPCNLYHFRALKQKLQLLDKAITTYDGNVILTVTLFLENTLNFNIFLQKIVTRKLALDHYCIHLIKTHNLNKLSSIQMITDANFDMIDIFYLLSKNVHDKRQLQLKLEKHMIEQVGSARLQKELLTNYKHFIDWQVKRNSNTDSVIEELAQLFRNNLEKYGTPEKSDCQEFKNTMKISDFQYQWIKLNVLSALSMWNKLLEFFVKPNWLTKRKEIKSALDEELIILTLHKHGAPTKLLEEFFSVMPLEELTLYLAKKLQCHRFVIDYYITQKDRMALSEYMQTLSVNSEELLYATNSLRSDKRWKN